MENRHIIEAIYDAYYRDVFQFALFFTNNRQEAEDITQETFIKVMKNIHRIRESDKLKVWIIAIARNTAIDLKRKQRFISFLPDWRAEKETDYETPEKKLLEKGEWVNLQNALLELKPHYRTIVILRGLKELSVKETADITGCSERKVRVDYHRALQILRKHVHSLEEGWGLANE